MDISWTTILPFQSAFLTIRLIAFGGITGMNLNNKTATLTIRHIAFSGITPSP